MSLREEFDAIQKDHEAEQERHSKAAEALGERIVQLREKLEKGETVGDHLLDGIVRHLWGGFEYLGPLMSKCRELEAKLEGKKGQFILVLKSDKVPFMGHMGDDLIPPDDDLYEKYKVSLGVLNDERLGFDGKDGRSMFVCDGYVTRAMNERAVLTPGPLVLSAEETHVVLLGPAFSGSRLRVEIVAGDQEIVGHPFKYHLRLSDLVRCARLLKRPLDQVPALAEEFARLQQQYLGQLETAREEYRKVLNALLTPNARETSREVAKYLADSRELRIRLERQLAEAGELELEGHEQVQLVRKLFETAKSLGTG